MRSRICAECDATVAAIWRNSDDWEYVETGYFDLLDREPEAVRTMLRKADDVILSNPEGAFAIYLELANSGSPIAAHLVGWSLDSGTGVARDQWQAMEWYCKALDAGSWSASVAYARILDQLGFFELCDEVLEDVVSAGLATARSWLARLRSSRSKGRRSELDTRLLLDLAVELGHPGAELYLAQLMAGGAFGLGSIYKGIRLFMACLERFEAGSIDDEILTVEANQNNSLMPI